MNSNRVQKKYWFLDQMDGDERPKQAQLMTDDGDDDDD